MEVQMSKFKDYKNFHSNEENAPKHLGNNLSQMIHKELTPSHSLIFGKVLASHAIIGLSTMLFCPQFGLSLTNQFDLFHYYLLYHQPLILLHKYYLQAYQRNPV